MSRPLGTVVATHTHVGDFVRREYNTNGTVVVRTGKVVLTIDLDYLSQLMGLTAVASSRGVSTALHGAIKAKVMQHTVTPARKVPA